MEKRKRFLMWGAVATIILGALLFPMRGTGTVQIESGFFGSAPDGDRKSVQLLSDALKSNPKAPRFRVQYQASRGGGKRFLCDVEYDRRSKTVSERSIRSGARQRLVYQNVTDADIIRIAQQKSALHNLKSRKSRLAFQPDYFSQLRFRVFGE